MTHYRMLDRAPSVVITSNRNELKVYHDNIVYLNNGDNFELRFFNPLKDKVGVEIIFNGVKKGDSYLVLNPGQDITLDRFLDEKRKMLFETYKIDGNNQEAVKAIENNGLITFNFYKEYYNQRFNPNADVNVKYDFPPEPQNSRGIFFGAQGVQGPAGGNFNSFTTTNKNSRIYSKSASYSTLHNIGGVGSVTSTSFNSPGVYLNEVDMSYFSSDMSDMKDLEIETGRVEKGESSDQNLRTVNVQFAQSPFYTISYKIMPYSEMNKTTNEIRQYCPNCRYRIRKSTWKFCPSCGEEL